MDATQREALKKHLSPMVLEFLQEHDAERKKAHDDAVAELRQIQADLSKQHTDWMSELGKRQAPTKEDTALAKNRLGRMAVALLLGGNDLERAGIAAETKLGDKVLGAHFKALSAGTDTEGGFLIPEEVSRDVIEVLRATAVVPAYNPIMVPLNGNTYRLPKLTTGASGGWIGENANAPATQQVFGSVNLTPKKRAALVPVSNDLIRRAPQSVESIVQQDLVGEMAAALDLAYLRADGSGGQPTGFLNQSGIQTFNANATVNIGNVVSDLGNGIQLLMDANVRMIRPGWIFAPRTWRALYTAVNSNGFMVFRDEMMTGKLLGLPFKVTSQIPTNLGGGTNQSEVYLADFADVAIGEPVPIAIDVSSQAAYHDGSNVVAAFSLDQTVVRAIVETDLALRHAESVVVIAQVTWTSITS